MAEVILVGILVIALFNVIFVEERRIDRLKIRHDIAERKSRFKV